MDDHSVTKGKIVLVPFPFDDLSATKMRPAACLTDPVGPHRHVVLAFITSSPPAYLLDTDILLDHRDPSFQATGLRVSSTLQVHRLLTVSTAIIVRELGMLSSELQDDVENTLRRLFQLS